MTPYTPPEPSKFIAEVRLWPSGKQHKMEFQGFTESQLRAEVERVRRETVEECAKEAATLLAHNGSAKAVDAISACVCLIRNLK